jgi:CRP-like cAMP-binding protein
MRERIEKEFEALNKLGTVAAVSLLPEYRDERLNELKMVFEAAEKRQQEKEEQRRILAEQREEERVQRELLKEKEDAEKEEGKFENSIEKVRREIEASAGAERVALQAKIQQLEADLADAHARKERALAQAQLTKAGHVYIISNIGAFGEGVLKIGLTRRKVPDERIHELGDASVPFPFDKHALIYSENAPKLEEDLQECFRDKRLNLVNDRKEFFRISLDEVKAQLSALGIKVDILSIPEAKEYRQTKALTEKEQKPNGSEPVQAQARFPNDPFESPEETKHA